MAVFTLNSDGSVRGTDLTHSATANTTTYFVIMNDSDTAVTGNITIASAGSTDISITAHGGNIPSGHNTARDTYSFPALASAAARTHPIKMDANSSLVFFVTNSHATLARNVVVDASTFASTHGTAASVDQNIFAGTV